MSTTLRGKVNEGHWRERAACRNVEPHDLFFREDGESIAAAKALCAECPVKGPCLRFVMAQPVNYPPAGVWAGTSGRQRKLRRQELLREAGLA